MEQQPRARSGIFAPPLPLQLQNPRVTYAAILITIRKVEAIGLSKGS